MLSRIGGFLGALTVLSKIDFGLGAVHNFNEDVHQKFKTAGIVKDKSDLIYDIRERLSTLNVY